jgi:hypothetical protein
VIEDDDEETKRLKREGLLDKPSRKPRLETDDNGYIKGGCLLDCLEWLQTLHEGFKCTGNLINSLFDKEKV